MVRSKTNIKKGDSSASQLSCAKCPDVTFENASAVAEHMRQHSEAGDASPTKPTRGKGEKRKATATKSTSPRKKAKAAATTLALFSDIDDVPEIPDVPVATNAASEQTPAREQSKGKADASNSESENPIGEEIPEAELVQVSSKEHHTLSAELRKVSSMPFVVTNQMAFSGEVPTAVRSLHSLSGMEVRRDSSFRERNETDFLHTSISRDRQELSSDQCEKVFECDKCRRVYFTIYSLRLHIRQQHTNTGRKIRCPHCKFVFFKLSGLRDHLSRGRCEKNKAKEEARKKALEEAEKKAQEAAEKAGADKAETSSLNISDIGGEKKPAAMNPRLANRIFEPLLEKAMCIVEPKEGEKPPSRRKFDPKNPVFKCDMCSKSFQLRDSLRRHYKQVHIYLKEEQLKSKMKNLKPPQVVYKCPVQDCQKILPTKKNFKLHYKNIHPSLFNELLERQMRDLDESVLYECPTCSRSYYLEASYLKHREECGDVEEEDYYDGDIDYDLYNEPWVEPKEDLPGRGRRSNAVKAEEMTGTDSVPDTQCRYCGKLFFTIYGRIDHERKHLKGEATTSAIVAEPAANPIQRDDDSPDPNNEEQPPLVKVAPGPIVIRCLDCNKTFLSFENLERHHTAVHLPKQQALTS